jgi:CheY-like chemotaxis protein
MSCPNLNDDVATATGVPFEDQGWQGSGTVLVVEDEETVRLTVEKILTALGFSVVLAVDGEDGVVKFGQNPEKFRLVLLDFTMPKLDGVQVFEELRRISPDIRVVLMSGYGRQEATARFWGKGLDGFIAKPFDIPTLQSTLKAVLA